MVWSFVQPILAGLLSFRIEGFVLAGRGDVDFVDSVWRQKQAASQHFGVFFPAEEFRWQTCFVGL